MTDSRERDARWLNQSLGGVPHWVTIAAFCLLAAMAVYVVWDRGQTSAAPAWTPPPVASPSPSVTPSPSPVATPTATPEAEFGLTVVVGDSFTTGSAEDSGPEARWPALTGVEPLAVSGVGYVQGATTFVTLAEDIPADAETVVFFGSVNDSSFGYEDVRPAADQAFAIARENAPDAELIVIGPPWVDADPPPAILTLRDAVSDAASAAEARWVDPIFEEWFVGDEELIGADGLHPNDAGQAYLAERMRTILGTD